MVLVRPDEGFAWVVAIACFFINFLLVGLARSVSVLYVVLIGEHGISREAASFPFTLRAAIKNISGPLIGLLGQRYGIRSVTTIGGLVAALGSVLCYFAPDVFWITIFWGAIHGFGFGLSTVLHMMVIGQYFDKYKASALGLGYSGDCFGTFVFPVIIEHLLSTYDVKGTFLILGGIVLNVVPMGLLLKKPPWLKRDKRSVSVSKSIRSGSYSISKEAERRGHTNKGFVGSNENLKSNIKTEGKTVDFGNRHPVDSYVASMENNVEDPTSAEKRSLPAYDEVVSNRNRAVGRSNSSLSSANGSLRRPNLDHLRDNMERHGSLPPVFEKAVTIAVGNDSVTSDVGEDLPSHNVDKEQSEMQMAGSMKKRRTSSFMEHAHEIVHRLRSASFASQVAQEGFVSVISQESELEEDFEPESVDHYSHLDIDNFRKFSGTPNVLAVPSTKEGKLSLPSHTYQSSSKPSTLRVLVRTNLKPLFILISLTMAFYAFLFVGVLTIIIDYAVDHGISNDHGKFLIIGFSVTDLFGRLTFGQVIDRKLMQMKTYAGITMTLMGTLVAVIPLYSSFYYMMIIMCLYGFIQGGTAIMFPILVTTYMEKHEESIAMGCLNFYGGLLMLVMAPMIGYFRDSIGSYDGVFYILGGTVVAVGLMWQLEPLMIRFQDRKAKDQNAPPI